MHRIHIKAVKKDAQIKQFWLRHKTKQTVYEIGLSSNYLFLLFWTSSIIISCTMLIFKKM